MTITNASSEMEKTFKVMSGDYQKLEAPRKDNDYKRTMFSKQDNAKVNEMLDDFNDHPDIPDDDTGTIH